MTTNRVLITYQENFFFRKRKHILTENGIKTQRNDFFVKSDITTTFQELGGYLIQYKSELNIIHLFLSIFFLVIGIKGYLKCVDNDNIGWIISMCFLSSGAYWIVSMLLNLEHIGSFYFSHTTYKGNSTLEIKSKYPASEALQNFLSAIQEKQKRIAIDGLLLESQFDHETPLHHYEMQANRLRDIFTIKEEEFQKILEKINSK